MRMQDTVRDFGALRPISIPDGCTIDQAQLVGSILLSRHFQKYPPSESYQLAFWKRIIEHLEARDEVIPTK